MEKTVEAVYENGALRPLEPLGLTESQHVTVTVFDEADIARDHPLLVSPEEWTEAAADDVPLEDVRRALASLRSSLSQTIIEERRER